MSKPLDPSLSFATLTIGPGNQLAVAAARRSAESPGTYHPLWVHGAPGVGKTHLLHAIGHQSLVGRPKLEIVLEPMAQFADRLSRALTDGRFDEFRAGCQRIDLLLLDDAECLEGRLRLQNELLLLWDRMGQNGCQVVVAADRPPNELDALQTRLEARFARVLAVELHPPDRHPFGAPRGRRDGAGELVVNAEPLRPMQVMTAMPGVMAIPGVTAAGVPLASHGFGAGLRVVAAPGGGPHALGEAAHVEAAGVLGTEDDPFGSFLDDITSTVAEVVDSAPWKKLLAGAILRWGGEGLRTWRLEAALDEEPHPDVSVLIAEFETDAARLEEIAAEVGRLLPGLAGSAVLRDPDRLAEAEALLWGARLEQQPIPGPDPALTLGEFVGRDGVETAAVSLARRLGAGTAQEHNPVTAYGPPARCRHYLAGIGNAAAEARPELSIGFVSGEELAGELGAALEAGYPDLWRRRYEGLDLLLLDGIEPLLDDDRVQEVLYVLVDALLHNGAQVIIAAQAPPRRIAGLRSRLAQRLTAGLSVDLSGTGARRLFNGTAYAATVGAVHPSGPDSWFFDTEKIAWDWVALEDRLVEEPA